MGAGESSNNEEFTGPVPIRIQNANPLLFTLPQEHMNIQPYWIMIVQLIVKDIILQRIWNRMRYGTWSTTQEIAAGHYILRKKLAEIREVLQLNRQFQHRLRGRQRQDPRFVRMKSFQDALVTPGSFIGPRFWTTNSLREHQAFKENILIQELEIARRDLNLLYGKLKFDLFDLLIHSLPLFAHTIWYFYIQSSCIGAEKANEWNCYNAFGYRLYNYIFVPYCAFFWLVVTKLYVYFRVRQYVEKVHKESLRKRIEYHIGLWPSLLTIIVVGLPLVPYLFTNVIPMAAAYVFMIIIYIVLWVAALAFCAIVSFIPIIGPFLLGTVKVLPKEDRPIASIVLMFPFTLLTLPILISVFFNYSQYLYYGNDYYGTMKDEFDSRNTTTYFKILQASINEQFHTSLNFV
ncbi:unnamed protein product [Adineta ricciae]|uniref:Uncharacterized protein n=1 Tax=Adineta ricciae TaxID=249248 RepID=A0A815HCD0_ADIRI|nr:unnamed protein product [Adineta ricciae]